MIIVYVVEQYNDILDKYEKIISHGYDTENDKNVVMQHLPLNWYGNEIKFDSDIGEYYVT